MMRRIKSSPPPRAPKRSWCPFVIQGDEKVPRQRFDWIDWLVFCIAVLALWGEEIVFTGIFFKHIWNIF